jgi:hypothetical protein
VSSDNPTPDQGQAIDNNVDNDPLDPPENNVEVEEALLDNTNTQIGNNPEDTNIATMSLEELFRVEYFVPLVDQAIASLTTRFEQYKDYKKKLVSYLLRKHCSRWMTRA